MGFLKNFIPGIKESLGLKGHDKVGNTVGQWMNNITGTTDAFNNSVQAQWDFWNANNAYNSPSNQMQLYKDAGLNPNLVYGSGGSHSYSTGSAPSMSAGGSGVLGTLLSLFGIKADLALKAAQTKLVNNQANAIGLENVENASIGTSRTTPYPVKLAKSAVNTVAASANGLAAMADSKIGNSDMFNVIDDVLSGRFKSQREFYRKLDAKGKAKYKEILRGMGYDEKDFGDW